MRSRLLSWILLAAVLGTAAHSLAQDVACTVKLTDMAGAELSMDKGNYVAPPGLTDLKAQVWVDDLRATGTSGGVFAGYVDLSYNKDIVDWVGGSIQYAPGFDSGQEGSVDEPNRLVDDAGAFRSAVSPPGADPPQLLFTVDFKVTGTLGYPDDVVTFQLGPAPDAPKYYTLVYGSNDPVDPVSYGSASLVPEPSCVLLLLTAAPGLLKRRRHSRKASTGA